MKLFDTLCHICAAALIFASIGLAITTLLGFVAWGLQSNPRGFAAVVGVLLVVGLGIRGIFRMPLH